MYCIMYDVENIRKNNFVKSHNNDNIPQHAFVYIRYNLNKSRYYIVFIFTFIPLLFLQICTCVTVLHFFKHCPEIESFLGQHFKHWKCRCTAAPTNRPPVPQPPERIKQKFSCGAEPFSSLFQLFCQHYMGWTK